MGKVLYWLYITFGVGGVMLFFITIESLNWIPFTFLILGILSLVTAAHIKPSKFIYEIHFYEEGVDNYGDV